MIISFDKQICFIKGLKVAGTSIEVYLSQVLDDQAIVTPIIPEAAQHRPRNYVLKNGAKFYNHITASEVMSIIGAEKFKALKKFAVIRDPYEKIKSFYYFRLGTNNGNFTLDRAISDTSSEAVRLADRKGNLLIDHVLKYETLNADLAAFFTAAGIAFPGQLEVFEKSGYREKFSTHPAEFSKPQLRKIEKKFAFEFNYYPKQPPP